MDQTFHQKEGGPHRPSFTPCMSGNYTHDFAQAMRRADLSFNETIVGDGAIHRFSTGNKASKDGWYVFYGLAGAFGDWKQGLSETWSLKNRALA